jgi:hypothetical protein
MFGILFFVLIIVSGLSYMAGYKENYTKAHKVTNNISEAPLGPSDDKGKGSK